MVTWLLFQHSFAVHIWWKHSSPSGHVKEYYTVHLVHSCVVRPQCTLQFAALQSLVHASFIRMLHHVSTFSSACLAETLPNVQ